MALVYLTALTTVDYQHTAPLLTLFKNILEATNTRVQILTDREYSEKQRAEIAGNASKGLTGLISGVLVDTIFESKQKKLIKNVVICRDDRDVRVPLLRLFQEITAYNKSCLPEVHATIQKILLDKNEKSDIARAEALETLAHIVSQDASYRSEAMLMVDRHTKEQSTYIRKSTFRLLQTILKAGGQYATDAKVLDTLNKFAKDRDTQIQKEAGELLSTYTSKILH